MLDQGFPHCPIFPTAASRRSLGRVSVPVWLFILSDQLPIIGLVGLYPTNYLIRRGPVLLRPKGPFSMRLPSHQLIRYYRPFPTVIPNKRVCSHAFLTRLPRPKGRTLLTVRLACVKHAASVRSEPGSNSHVSSRAHSAFAKISTQFNFQCYPQTISSSSLLKPLEASMPPLHYYYITTPTKCNPFFNPNHPHPPPNHKSPPPSHIQYPKTLLNHH